MEMLLKILELITFILNILLTTLDILTYFVKSSKNYKRPGAK